MGCGHSKINVYFRKNKSQNNNDYAAVSTGTPNNEEKLIDPLIEAKEELEEYEYRKTSKVKPYGGALLAQAEISTSQQNFFKLLDEKIENGPDYDSENETEKAEREARIFTLLQNWQSASLRSLNNTPSHKSRHTNYSNREENECSNTFLEQTISSKSIEARNPYLYINSADQSALSYISDHNQNSSIEYSAVPYTSAGMQYRTISYSQETQAAYSCRRGSQQINTRASEKNYKPVIYQMQSNRYCKQDVEQTLKHNYYNQNVRANNFDSNGCPSVGIHENRIDMNPLHRKQYELT